MRWLLGLALGAALVFSGGWLWAGSADQPEAWEPPLPPAPLSQVRGELVLSVEPLEARIDVPVEIRVANARPSEEVILRARAEDGRGETFQSWARFLASAHGEVRLDDEAPVEGTWRSPDASGLLWSMRAPGGERWQFPATREIRIEVSAETTRGVVATTLVRENPARSIPFELAGNEVDATLWMPHADGPLPGVIRLHGSGGELDPIRSALLASEGFAILDLRWIAPGGLPAIAQIPIEKVVRGVDLLARDPRIDAERIGVYGASKGAELALLAAVHEPRITAVAVWTPASVAFEGIELTGLAPGSSWSWRGEPLPYAAYQWTASGLARHTFRMLFANVAFRPVYERALDAAPAEAMIPLERSDAFFLLLGGRDDHMWPTARMSEQLVERLEASGHRRHERVLYDGVGHSMGYAVWPDLHRPSRFVGGGSPEANHAAGRDAWRRIKELFRRELG